MLIKGNELKFIIEYSILTWLENNIQKTIYKYKLVKKI